MRSYNATCSLDEIGAGQAQPRDRIVCLPEGGGLQEAEPNDRQAADIAVDWCSTDTGVFKAAGSASPVFRSDAGIEIATSHFRIGLTWPGCDTGTLQVFVHPHWPGSYRSINVSPRFWTVDLLSFEKITLRGELLPDDPRRITGVPRSGFGTSCLRFHADIDLRFSFGHGWRQGDHVFRIGTSEIIAHAAGDGMTSDDGCYCADCIEAGFQVELTVPDGGIYNRHLNRSPAPDDEIRLRAKKLRDPEDPAALSIQRYGLKTFEWRLGSDPAACRDRLARARAISLKSRARTDGTTS
ncbi:hypothetical protein RM543_18865 [Roseicyclus sp. F158]|uniref:Uncharacterized protein n=1 Tax=Tropicimonas omnivorans TaxID=3075590 RepID=A0ABU3DLX8_9RHOB|nr:hypothetical protein [Roseicyclus sp. F158]MDT0684720.1 hypothetical protein [Roseicyclus sp. F158]